MASGFNFVLPLVLLAALLHASWNALVKVGSDRALSTAMIAGLAGVIALPLLPFVPPPAPASWPFIVASVVVQLGYLFGLSRMYETGEFSLVYPLARGLSPLIVTFGAAAFGGEALGLWQLAGVGMVSIGIVSLMFGRGWPRGDHRRAILFALFTCGTIGLYSLIDGLGVRRAHSSLGYIAWLFVIGGVLFVALTWKRRGNQLWTYFGRHWRLGLGGGAMSATAYGIVIWAMGQAAMAGVVSLRETGVIFAAVIGSLFMGEEFGRWRIAAAVLVAAGNVAIRL
jgi:drug/metabolite transporter (DMT)-like permease